MAEDILDRYLGQISEAYLREGLEVRAYWRGRNMGSLGLWQRRKRE